MKSMFRCVLAATFAITAVLVARSPVQAANEQWYSFNQSCTNLNATNVAIGQAQMYVRVSDGPGVGQVTFHFVNTGPFASNMTAAYFQDGSLLGIANITDGPGVLFHQYATPPNLPGASGCHPAFHVTAGFSADAVLPRNPNGINPHEWLDIRFNLQAGEKFSDVIAELNSGALRIGIYVQWSGPGNRATKESFINAPFTAVRLASFDATAADRQVTLAWRTGSEISNAGFNLYRATSASGNRVKVNDRLIASQGTEASGSSYSSLDVPGYGRFYYWLEDVDNTGLSSLHGPIQVDVRASVQRPLYRPAPPGTSR